MYYYFLLSLKTNTTFQTRDDNDLTIYIRFPIVGNFTDVFIPN